MQTTLYKKPTDRQNYLHAKSAHPVSLKKRIPYSQALRMKRVCSTSDECKKRPNDLVKRFVQKGYKENIIRNQIKKLDNLERSTSLNKTNAVLKIVIPISVKYSPTLPNFRKIINKHWYILNINNTVKNVFKATPVIAFCKNTSIRLIIGTSKISHNQKLLKVKQNVAKGECIPCNTSGCLSCQQIIATTTFESIQTKQKFNIYSKISCKSNYVIYLLECLLCKMQYIGKSETPFYIRLNNHRKDIKHPNAIEACKHFNNWNHIFHKHGKFILMEQLRF